MQTETASAVLLVLFGNTGAISVVMELFSMLGNLFLFRKCGVKIWKAFIPFYREYAFAGCAGAFREGRTLVMARIVTTACSIVVLYAGKSLVAIRYMGAAVAAVAIIISLIYDLRVYRRLCRVFEETRLWMILWFFMPGLASMIWGLSAKFVPKYDELDPGEEELEGTVGQRKNEAKQKSTIIRDEMFLSRVRGLGWFGQLGTCLGRMLRSFVFRSDWLVFPLSAIIVSAIAFVVRDDLFLTMEGTLKGAYCLTALAIWNGCFHSLQVIARERPMLHQGSRQGLHMSAYLLSQVIYQGLLCLGETALMLYIFSQLGITFPSTGYFTRWFSLELGLSVFLITFSADMLALLISSIARTATSAMTTMTFILIIQMFFSGGLLRLPDWTKPIQNLMIGKYGVEVIGSQANYNELPMVTASNVLEMLMPVEVGKDFTVNELLEFVAGNSDNKSAVNRIRDTAIIREMSIYEILEALEEKGILEPFLHERIFSFLTVEDIVDLLVDHGVLDAVGDKRIGMDLTIGQVIDYVRTAPELENVRQTKLSLHMTIGQIVEGIGEQSIRELLDTKSAEVSRIPEFELSQEKIVGCWMQLLIYSGIYIVAALLILKLIHRKKQ